MGGGLPDDNYRVSNCTAIPGAPYAGKLNEVSRAPHSDTIAYFGYGSLVNLDTLRTPYISAHRARLKGWQRRWLARPKVENSFAPIEGLAFLSAEKCEDVEIDGIVIVDHRTSLVSLDEREALYDRLSVDHSSITFLDDNPLGDETELFIYSAQEPAASDEAFIIRSYLDAVMQGYRTHFGDDGVINFVRSTAGFDTPIRDDRNEPLYPRAVNLSQDELEYFNSIF